MQQTARCARMFRFGPFEFDPENRELRKHGLKLRLIGQPMNVLTLLLDRRGELVSREELRQLLWASDTFVEFEHGVNAAVMRLREALGDSADKPQYVETIPRQGYRFIAPVEMLESNAPSISKPLACQISLEPGRVCAPPINRRPIRWIAAIILAAIALSVYLIDWKSLKLQIGRGSTNPPQISSIAILPLLNMSADPEQEYFADGMTDELVATLSKIRSLRVISRTSVMQYKGTRKTIPQIARELNVDAVIEGSVVRSGARVRVTAQLIYAASDTHLWAQTYERDLTDVLTIQNEITEDIAREIKATLPPAAGAELARSRPVNPKAHELFLRGRYYLLNGQIGKAQESFSEAVKEDSEYAAAYAGVADSLNLLALYEYTPGRDAFPLAKAAAVKALEIDGTLAEGHTSLAWTKLIQDWDWSGAEQEFRRALELNPSYETAHLWYGLELVWQGKLDSGVAEVRRAQELAPFGVRTALSAAWVFALARQYDTAILRLKEVVELHPTEAGGHVWLGLTYLQKGMHEQAIAETRKGVDLAELANERPVNIPLGRLGYAYGVSGKKREAIMVLERLRKMSKTMYVSAFTFAIVHVGLGQKDQAFRWLQKAYDERVPELIFLKVDPRFDSLRSDPRFEDLLRRMNFPRSQ
jgi:TolB-like protein/DNA-binding winged helix-turn-helix (wHTH) protein/Tfp pilus assembly protein PilF